MRIEKLNIYPLVLPFSGEFSISRKRKTMSEIIVLEIMGGASEMRGYGEGVPIKAVTCETPHSVIEDICRFASEPSFPWELHDVSQIWDFVDGFPEGKTHNAAICTVEMALLDSLGKNKNRPIIDFFPHTHMADVVHYGAPVTLGSKEWVAKLCTWIKAHGITRIRIKMGKSLEQNQNALETVVSLLGHDCELRIDPNGAWDRDLAFKHLPLLIKHQVNIVEEPMKKEAHGFQEFAAALDSEGIILMACESAPTLEHIKRIINEKFYRMINVKLCRSGGFRKAIRMIDFIRKSPFSFQIGCTLGESGILSAAGRTLCLLSKDAVNYDGSYDRFLLKKNTTMAPVSFGPKGEAGPLKNPGLGVQVNRRALKDLAGSPIITIKRP